MLLSGEPGTGKTLTAESGEFQVVDLKSDLGCRHLILANYSIRSHEKASLLDRSR